MSTAFILSGRRLDRREGIRRIILTRRRVPPARLFRTDLLHGLHRAGGEGEVEETLLGTIFEELISTAVICSR